MSPNTALEIRSHLRGQVADLLYCEPDEIDDDADFQELGLDSVLGVELTAVINDVHGLEERAEVIRTHPTLNQLANYVVEKVMESRNGPAE
ncbi:acyl carrier protein [Streptomyces sp. NPDC001139]